MTPALKITTFTEERVKKLFGHRKSQREEHRIIEDDAVRELWEEADKKFNEALEYARMFVSTQRDSELDSMVEELST